MAAFRPRNIEFCSRCWLRSGLCYCGEIKQIELVTKVTVVMHAAERDKNSSTARLLSLMLKNCSIHQVGRPDTPFRGLPTSEPDVESLLLFPDASAPELSSEYCLELGKRIQLVVPDGTWSQAKRIFQRNESLYKLRRVRIPPAQTEYCLRRNIHPGTLCTAEAVAYALGIIEGLEVQNKILEGFREMSNRVLWGRKSSKAFKSGMLTAPSEC